MKIVTLCSAGSCCPVVKLTDDHVEIGEIGVTTIGNMIFEKPLSLCSIRKSLTRIVSARHSRRTADDGGSEPLL